MINVLYLDDEIDLCEIFADEFSNENIRITTFTDPVEAIAAAKTNPPDIMFLDYRLVATNGDKVAQKMANLTPKFLVTGDISVKTDYPFVEILSKPYNANHIRQVLSSMAIQKKSA